MYVNVPWTDTNTDTNNYISSASYNSGTGVLTLGRQGLSSLTVNVGVDTNTNTFRAIHDTPVNGATTTSISSNWAFDNVKTSVPSGAVFTDTNTQLSTAQVRAKVSGTGLISYNSTSGVISTTATNVSNTNQLTNGAGYITASNSAITSKLPLVTGVTAMHNTQGTQNSANTVLRTQVNGYAMLGWINTTSGATASTLQRIYCSQDGYIRYQTPANFGVSISPHINYNTIANTPTIPSNNNQLSNGAGYTTNTGTVTSVGGGTGLSGTVTTSGSLNLDSDLSGTVNKIGGTAAGTNYFDMSNNTQYTLRLGSTNPQFLWNFSGQFHANGDLIAFSTSVSSDKKLKENIQNLEGSLDKTLKLNGVKFNWKDKTKPTDQLGFIAQEVEEVLPELVSEVDSLGEDTGETHKVVNYQGVIPVLVEAIKELKAEIEELKNANRK
jgi:hypothetical protein